MGKPSEISPTLRVTKIHRWEDNLWDAVQEAQAANITPEQFKKELSQAWTEKLSRDAKHAQTVFKS